jgi:hypothetical protein
VLAHEPFGVAGVGSDRDVRAGGSHGVSVSMVDVVRGVVADPGVPVLGVVPGEEFLAVRSCGFDGANRSGKSGRYLSVSNWASENGLVLLPALRAKLDISRMMYDIDTKAFKLRNKGRAPNAAGGPGRRSRPAGPATPR